MSENVRLCMSAIKISQYSHIDTYLLQCSGVKLTGITSSLPTTINSAEGWKYIILRIIFLFKNLEY